MDFKGLKDKMQGEVEGLKGTCSSLLDQVKTIGKKKGKASDGEEDFDEDEYEEEEMAEEEHGVDGQDEFIDPESKNHSTSIFDRGELEAKAKKSAAQKSEEVVKPTISDDGTEPDIDLGSDEELDDDEEWDDDEEEEEKESLLGKIKGSFGKGKAKAKAKDESGSDNEDSDEDDDEDDDGAKESLLDKIKGTISKKVGSKKAVKDESGDSTENIDVADDEDSDEGDDDDSEVDDGSLVNKIKSKFVGADGKIDRSKVIRVFVIISIVLLFGSEFLPSTPDKPGPKKKQQTAKRSASQKKKRDALQRKKLAAKKKRDKVAKDKAAMARKKKQLAAKKAAAAKKSKLADQKAAEEAKKKLADQKAAEEAKKKLADQKATEKAKKKLADQKAAEEAKKKLAKQQAAAKKAVVPPSKLGETKVSKKSKGQKGVTQDISGQIGKIVSKIDDNPQMKLDLQKRIYPQAEPPVYTESGRGLVYNCAGRHWACVNKDSFLKCRGNMMWNKQSRKLPECVTRNVYRSSKDCYTIQTHNINTVKNTGFCK
jgi:hypothetical protein